MFGVDVYQARRKRLQEQVKSGGILLFLGNEESPMNYKDNPYHFRQDSTFLYFFGLNYASLAAVIDLDEGKETIFGDELTVDDIVWMGTQPTLKEKSMQIGVKNTAPSAQLKNVLQDAKAKERTVHILPPYRGEHTLKLMNLLNISFEDTQKTSLDFIKAVVDQRNVKSEEEIIEIDKAATVSADMHLAAYKMVRPGMKEYEIASKVQQVAKNANCELSFPIIATINGQTLHNHYHGNTLQSGGMFLLDAGAQTPSGYAGDLSSTMPIDPKFTDRQKEIYQIVYESHEAAIAMLKPGTKFKDVHLTAAKTIAEGMKNMGFMKGDMDEAVAQGAHALFFQCGTGHMMGMDVHDMENLGEQYVGYKGEPKSTQFGLKSLRLARELEPGFVLTIEPGIYFIPELIDMWKSENKFADFINWDKVESYKDFGGIRNEEDFVITDSGARLLGKRIPKSIEEVEAIRE